VAPRLSDQTSRLVDDGDLDELIRHIDRLCGAAAWDALVDLRDRCRRAYERGRQLWPAASHAEYRLALEAPGEWAAPMLVPGSGRFALGPLAEVAASTHTWDELAAHAPAGPPATIAAHERVVRGEDLTGDARVDPYVLELPLRLQPWEPRYPVATYRAHECDIPMVPPPLRPLMRLPHPAVLVDDSETCRALLDLAETWVTESNGQARAVAVDGDAVGAIAQLTGESEVFVDEVQVGAALAIMASTAASGGAHGRRRGMASGRFGAWWAAAALADLLDQWPVGPDELGNALGHFRWYHWNERGSIAGWVFRVAVETRDKTRAWAVSAEDVSRFDEVSGRQDDR
jgi:hypothetical protein